MKKWIALFLALVMIFSVLPTAFAEHRTDKTDEEPVYVFTEEDGHVMHPHTPTKQFDHFLKRHNIRHLKFHGLRHTSATWLLAQGCDLKTVSARLGHADLETTGIYVHAMQEMDRSAADKFDSFFFPNKED